MIELYLSKVTENSESEQAGKLYARVSYKQTMGVREMAHHMAEHNTKVLMGNTVKIDNLAIFKATVEANALETLYDAAADKVATASIGNLGEGDKTGPAVKVIKLLAQSTGDFTRDELRKDVKLAWTDKTKAEIAEAKGDTPGGTSSNPSQGGGDQNQGGTTPTNPDTPGGDGTTDQN